MGGRKDLASKRQLSMIEESDDDSSDEFDSPHNCETVDNEKENNNVNVVLYKKRTDNDEQNRRCTSEGTMDCNFSTGCKDSAVGCFLIKHFVKGGHSMPVVLEDSLFEDSGELFDNQDNGLGNIKTDEVDRRFYRNECAEDESLRPQDCVNDNCNCDWINGRLCGEKFRSDDNSAQIDKTVEPGTKSEGLDITDVVNINNYNEKTQDKVETSGLDRSEAENNEYLRRGTNILCQQDGARDDYTSKERIHEMFQVLIKTIEGDVIHNTPKQYTELEADDLVKDTTLMFLTQDRVEGQPKAVNNIISTFKEKFSLPNAKHQPVRQKSRRSLELEKLAAKNRDEDSKRNIESPVTVSSSEGVKHSLDDTVREIKTEIYEEITRGNEETPVQVSSEALTNLIDDTVNEIQTHSSGEIPKPSGGTQAMVSNEALTNPIDDTVSEIKIKRGDIPGPIEKKQVQNSSETLTICTDDTMGKIKTKINEEITKPNEETSVQISSMPLTNPIDDTVGEIKTKITEQVFKPKQETQETIKPIDNKPNSPISQNDTLDKEQTGMAIVLYSGDQMGAMLDHRFHEKSKKLHINDQELSIPVAPVLVNDKPSDIITTKQTITNNSCECKNSHYTENVPFDSTREKKLGPFFLEFSSTKTTIENVSNLTTEISPTSPVTFADIIAEHMLITQGSFDDEEPTDFDHTDQSNHEVNDDLAHYNYSEITGDRQLLLPLVQIISDNDEAEISINKTEESNNDNMEDRNPIKTEISRDSDIDGTAENEPTSICATTGSVPNCKKLKVRFAADQAPSISGTNSLLVTSSSLSSSPSTSFLSVPNQVLKTTASYHHIHGNLGKPPMLRHVSQPNMGTSHKANLVCQDVSSNSSNQNKEPKYATKDLNSDLAKLKATAIRLKLTTRRPSYVEWLEQYRERRRKSQHLGNILSDPPVSVGRSTDSDEISYRFPRNSSSQFSDGVDRNGPDNNGALNSCSFSRGSVCRDNDKLTAERKQRIEKSLDWLKTELQLMKTQDQSLARQLLSLYHDIHKVRLSWSCQEHRELLDEVRYDLEELYEFSNVLDLPRTCLLDTPLKHVGVTRMNISARRFSAC